MPWYAAVYLLIGACIFGPTRKVPLVRQAVAFFLPGALLVVLALLGRGFWAGGWLVGLPPWGLLVSRWTPGNPLRVGQLLQFAGLWVLGLVIFTFNAIWVVFSLGLFLLPVIPLIGLAYPEYRARPLRAGAEVLLAAAAVVVAVAIPTPEGAWASPWIYAGGAANCRADDRVLGLAPPPAFPEDATQYWSSRLGSARQAPTYWWRFPLPI